MSKDAFTVINDEGEKLVDGSRFAVSVGFGQGDARTKELTGKDTVKFEIVSK